MRNIFTFYAGDVMIEMTSNGFTRKTNLLPSSDGESEIKSKMFMITLELKEFMKVELDKSLSEIVCSSIVR